eukprot:CAMPEP_0167747882 /NCGR_PEP_ID=MMETSP0110_2-20121227/4530_1 /TAXON_ID=629695 /ORGANISM="Gymnochlora sp., Strain CCMP2014" /LENGTH=276 /DNA_ID=CAMNT_0007632837 /DNA_START=68 /DNA_END=898 /DNA_ORIENTATION=+
MSGKMSERGSMQARGSVCAARAGKEMVMYDVPVANHGARVRMMIYAKGIEDQVKFESPKALGGLKSEEYLKLNPMGKMPILTLGDGTAIPESTAILRYLESEFPNPTLTPQTAIGRARSDYFGQIVDAYMSPIQGCMYRGPMEASTRAEQLKQIKFSLDAMEHLLSSPAAPGADTPSASGPFCAGEFISLGDVIAYPTIIFTEYMLPAKFGWKDIFASRPGLNRWYHAMNEWGPAEKVRQELIAALKKWDDDGRWVKVGIEDQVAHAQDDVQFAYE